MPLPLTVSCFSKIQTGFTFLVPAHPDCPRKRPLNGCVLCSNCLIKLFFFIVVLGQFLVHYYDSFKFTYSPRKLYMPAISLPMLQMTTRIYDHNSWILYITTYVTVILHMLLKLNVVRPVASSSHRAISISVIHGSTHIDWVKILHSKIYQNMSLWKCSFQLISWYLGLVAKKTKPKTVKASKTKTKRSANIQKRPEQCYT